MLLCLLGGVLVVNVASAGALTFSSPILADSGHSLTGVSCPSSGFCVAVDNAGQVLASSSPGTSSWTVEKSGLATLVAVSCAPGTTATSGLCMAISYNGNAYISTDPSGGSSSWVAAAYPPHSSDESVVCPTTGYCLITTEGGWVNIGTVTGTSVSWEGNGHNGGGFKDISCGSISFCVHIDGNNVDYTTTPTSNVEWVDKSVGVSARAVSCAPETTSSSGVCVAAAGGGDVSIATDPSGSWTPKDVDGSNNVAAVSCASTTLCVAVGAAGEAAVSTAPGSSWEAAEDIDGSNSLTSVSCVEEFCAAVDSSGYVVTTAAGAPAAPSNTSVPTLGGSSEIGASLTTSNGSWSGSSPITYTYQWQDCNGAGEECLPITGANSEAYEVQPSDVGHTLVSTVTAENAYGSASSSSAATQVVQELPPSNIASPTINGSAEVGASLSAAEGTWSGSLPISYAYQWEDCNASGGECVPIAGATTESYEVQLSDVGHTIVVTSTATNAYGHAASSSSATSVVGAPAPSSTEAPSLSGVAEVDETLSSNEGSWEGNYPLNYTYQWEDCNTAGEACVPIAGAESASYEVQTNDIGHTLVVAVTATNTYGSATSASIASAVVPAPAPVNVSAPELSGSAHVGGPLSATTGSWKGVPAPSYTYQWQLCDSSGNGCTAISGATSSSYTLLSGDVGHTLRALVTAENSYGQSSERSAPSGVVAESSPWSEPVSIDSNSLNAISCFSSSLCMAVDSSNGARTSTNPTGGAGAWATSSVPDPDSLGVSCPTASLCVAASSGGYAPSATISGNTVTEWYYAPEPGSTFKSISCSSSSFCAYTYGGEVWHNTASPVRNYYGYAGVSSGGVAGDGISCAPGTTTNSGLCVVVGGGGRMSYATEPGVGWAAGEVIDSSNTLTSISCPTTSLCVAVDNAGNVLVSTDPTGGASDWASTSIDSGHGLTSVSCTISEDCVAVDNAGNAVVSHNNGESWGAPENIDVHSSLNGVSCVEEFCAAVDSGGQVLTATITLPSSAPSNTVAPVVNGNTEVGDILTTTNGSWSGSRPLTYSYEWDDCNAVGEACSPISGAENSSYSIQSSDLGHTIRSLVKAENAYGSASESSSSTAVVAGSSAYKAEISSGDPVDWWRFSDSSNTNWVNFGSDSTTALSSGSGVLGDQASSPGDSPGGHSITLESGISTYPSNATDSHEISGSFTVEGWIKPSNVSSGTIVSTQNGNGSGSGATFSLSLTSSDHSGVPGLHSVIGQGHYGNGCSGHMNEAADANYSFTAGQWYYVAETVTPSGYQIYVDGEALANSTASACGGTPFLTGSAPEGGGIVPITVGADVPNNSNNSAFSGSLSNVAFYGSALSTTEIREHYDASLTGPPVNTSVPTVSGSAFVGATLTTTTGEWEGARPLSYSYQWQRCSAEGSECSSIAGAESPTYTIQSNDLGHSVRLSATATNAYGDASASSSPTAVVQEASRYQVAVSADGPIDWWRLNDSSPWGNSGVDTRTLGGGGANVLTGQESIVGDEPGGSITTNESITSSEDPNAATGTGTLSTISGSFTVEEWVKSSKLPPQESSCTGENRCAGINALLSTRAPVEYGFDTSISEGYGGGPCGASGASLHSDIGNGSTWLSTSADACFSWAPSTWYHLVETVTPTNYKIYINGVEKGSGSISGTPLLQNASHELSIAATAPNSLIGSTSNVALYNYALSSAQIQTHYEVGSTGHPLEATAPVLSDSSAPGVYVAGDTLSATHGTWTGSPTAYAYQWRRGNSTSCNTSSSAISGATSSTYATIDADAGSVICVTVTASNSYGNSSPSLSSTNVYADSSGNANDATGLGSLENALSGPFSRSFSVGFSGGAISTPTNPVAKTTNWSLEAWVDPSNLNQYGAIIYNGQNSTGYGFFLTSRYVGGSGWPDGGCLTGLVNPYYWIETGYCFPSANQWYDVVETNNENLFTFYVNGVKVYSGNKGTPVTPAGGTQIGGNPVFGSPFQGRLSNVSLYSAPLSEARVQAHYAAGSGQPAYAAAVQADSPTVYYRLNDYAPLAAGTPANIAAPVLEDKSSVGAYVAGDTLAVTNGSWSSSPTSYSYQWYEGNATACSSSSSAIAGATSAEYVTHSANAGKVLCAAVTATNAHGSGEVANVSTKLYVDSTGTVANNATSSGSLTNALAGPFTSSYAVGFHGNVGESISNSSATPITGTSNWTLEGWIDPSSTNQTGEIVYNGDEGGSGAYEVAPNGFGLMITGSGGSGNGDCLEGLADAVAWVNSGYCSFSANHWYYVSMVDSGGNVSFYVGEPGSETPVFHSCASACSGFAPRTPTGMMIGGYQIVAGGTAYNRFFQGDISNVAYYSSALSEEAIKAHLAEGTEESEYADAVLAASPSAYYRLNDSAPLTSSPLHAPKNLVLPMITGIAEVGHVLTATNGAWGGTLPISYSYQWQNCGTTGSSCSSISGATGSTYTPQSSEAGDYLRVVVTATNEAGSISVDSLTSRKVYPEECSDLYEGNDNGEWNVATNWSKGSVPTSTDVACIPSGITVSATHGTAAAVIGGNLNIPSGTFSLASKNIGSSLEKLTVEAAVFGLAGKLEVTSYFQTGNAATVEGGGNISLENGSEDKINAYVYNYSSSCTDLTLAQETTLTNNSTLGFINIGASVEYREAKMGSIAIGTGSRVINHGTLVLNPENRAGYGCSSQERHGQNLNGPVVGGTGELVNTGTLTKTEGEYVSIFETALVNTGTISSTQGTLSFYGNDNSKNGTWETNGSGVLNVEGGIFTSNGDTWKSGAAVALSGGALKAINDSAAGANLVVSGGTIFNNNGTLSLNSFTLERATLSLGSQLEVTHSFVAGHGAVATGGGLLTLSSSTTGNFHAEIYGGSNDCTNLALEDGTSLTNDGTLGFIGVNGGSYYIGGYSGGISVGSGSKFTNNGSFNITPENIHGYGCSGASTGNGPVVGGAGTFVNTGVTRKMTNSGSSVIATPVNNSGTLKAETGTIEVLGGGSSSNGTWDAASGAAFSLESFNFGPGNRFTGSGSVAFNGGKVTVGSGDTLPIAPSLTMSSTPLGVAGTLEANGSLTTYGTSTISSGGNFVIGSEDNAHLDSSTASEYGGRNWICTELKVKGAGTTLVNNGTLGFDDFANAGKAGGITLESGTVFENAGVFEDEAENEGAYGACNGAQGSYGSYGATISGGGKLLNTGTIVKPTGVRSDIEVETNNDGVVTSRGGTLTFDSGGVAGECATGSWTRSGGGVELRYGRYEISEAVTEPDLDYTLGVGATDPRCSPQTAPVNTVLPGIVGTPEIGVTLTAELGRWIGEATIGYSYQWQSCNSSGHECENIGGATSAEYTVPLSEEGHDLVLVVTATNSHGSSSATSAPVAVANGVEPINEELPEIKGTAAIESKLLANEGEWIGTAPISYTYQWQRCEESATGLCGAEGTGWENISGAASPEYTVREVDADHFLRIVVTADNAVGMASAYSEKMGPISGLAPTSEEEVITEGAETKPSTEAGAEVLVAQLRGTFKDIRGYKDTYLFEYGLKTKESCSEEGNELSHKIKPSKAINSGVTGDVALQQETEKLVLNKTYCYRAVVTTSSGVPLAGEIKPFTTGELPPEVTGEEATEVTTSTAILHATINPEASETSYHFEYVEKGKSHSEATATTTFKITANAGSTNVSFPIDHLGAPRTYEFWVVATNEAGEATKTVVTFETRGEEQAEKHETLESETSTNAKECATEGRCSEGFKPGGWEDSTY